MTPFTGYVFDIVVIKRQKGKTKKAVAAVRRLPPASFPQKCRQALLIYLFFPNMDFYLSNYLFLKMIFILSRIFLLLELCLAAIGGFEQEHCVASLYLKAFQLQIIKPNVIHKLIETFREEVESSSLMFWN